MTGGGGSGSTTTVQKSDPWEGQQPYLERGFQEAARLFGGGPPQYYPGQTYAPPNVAMTNALNQQVAQAGAGSPLAGASQQAALGILSPEFAASNPGNRTYEELAGGGGVQDAIASAVQNATPGLLDAFTQGNRLGSPSAAYGVGQGVANAAAPIVLAGRQAGAEGLSRNYLDAARTQNQANALAPSLQAMPYFDIAKQYEAGQAQQQLEQNEINDEMARYNYEQTAPFNLLDWYNSAIGGSYGGTQTLTSPYFRQGGGGLGGGLSGALSGASMGSFLGPWGMAGGGLLGGLLGGFL